MTFKNYKKLFFRTVYPFLLRDYDEVSEYLFKTYFNYFVTIYSYLLNARQYISTFKHISSFLL